MKKQQVKYFEEIKSSEFDFSNIDIQLLINTLLDNIGHEDSYIRDHLVYEILAHVFHDQILNETMLEEHLKRFIGDEFLFFDLNNQYPNSVLKRSFTILQLVILVYVHQRDSVINQQLISETFDKFLIYYSKEKVLTGYDKTYGWVHAIAHSADLMNTFMDVSWFTEGQIEKMFDAIGKKIKIEHHFYMFNEDERLATALKTGLDRKLVTHDFVFNWIDDMVQFDENIPLPNDVIIKNNVKQLLRSLYFKCIKDESLKDVVHKLESVLVK
ncbi:hypothetical protein BK010_09670 [Tenericutes bacterium MO-XQ]|nr:hypothetical protein BK010_09670 [Tenericutes bacterium MO-XQ]